MGFINLAKDLVLKQGGKHGVHLLRTVGKAVAPGLERSAERAVIKHKTLLNDIGSVGDNVFKAADAFTTGDSDKFIGASTKGLRGIKKVARDVKATGHKRKAPHRVPDKRAGSSAEVDPVSASQPRISGDLMERMAKVARTG